MSAKPPVPPPARLTWRLLAAAILLLAAAGWSFYQVNRSWWSSAEFKAGEAALNRDDFVGARTHLLNCLSARHDYPEAHFLLGRLARRQDREDEALEQLRLCEADGSMAASLALERLMLRAQKGELRGGARAPDLIPAISSVSVEGVLMAALRTEKSLPERAVILEALARGSMQSLRLAQALTYLDLWLEGEPRRAHALLYKAATLTMLERELEARAAPAARCRRAWCAEGQLALAESLTDDADAAQALQLFDTVLGGNPTSTRAALGKVRCLLTLERPDEAKSALAALAPAEAEQPAALLLHGQVELAQQDLAAAEPWLRRAVDAAPADRQALASLALCLTRQSRFADARPVQDRIERIDRQRQAIKDMLRKIIAAPAVPPCAARPPRSSSRRAMTRKGSVGSIAPAAKILSATTFKRLWRAMPVTRACPTRPRHPAATQRKTRPPVTKEPRNNNLVIDM